MEFDGPGLANMDMAARATVANMSVDMGFTACIFPSDEVTRDFLARNSGPEDFRELLAGSGAEYERDHARLSSTTSSRWSPARAIRTTSRRPGTWAMSPVHQVIIGSSCNGDYQRLHDRGQDRRGQDPPSRRELRDQHRAAGRPWRTSWPRAGSRRSSTRERGSTSRAASAASAWARRRPRAPTRCAPSRATSRAAAGTMDDAVYLCSPETAAASALTGRITDPRTSGPIRCVDYPETYTFNPKWFVMPSEDPGEVELVKGPNIKPFPRFPELEDAIKGEVLIKVKDNVSTDIIMPAGTQVLPLRSNIPEISNYVFYVVDKGFASAGQGEGRRRRRRRRELRPGLLPRARRPGAALSRRQGSRSPRASRGSTRRTSYDFGILPLEFADASGLRQYRSGRRRRGLGAASLRRLREPRRRSPRGRLRHPRRPGRLAAAQEDPPRRRRAEYGEIDAARHKGSRKVLT